MRSSLRHNAALREDGMFSRHLPLLPSASSFIYGRYASYQLPINWSPTAVHGNVKDEERVSYASYVSAAVGPGLQVTNARPASRRYAVEYRYTWIA